MATVAEEMITISEAKLEAYQSVLSDIKHQTQFMTKIPYEIKAIEVNIEGRIMGVKNFIRSIKS